MNKGVRLTTEVLIGKWADLTEKSTQDLIITIYWRDPRELLKRITDQPRTHFLERLTAMNFEGFLEG